MRAVPVLVLVLAAGPAFAASEKLSGGLAEIVAAERAFARRCGEVGVRASFLEFFGPKAVSFAPDPGPARERLEKRPVPPSPPPVLLEWGPEQAEIARAGDLGWTTGPSSFTDKTGEKPPYHGYYFSLWRKQPDGTWKVELDMGVEAPATPIPTVASAAGPLGKKVPTESGADAIQREDEAFCKLAEGGAGKAYAAALAPNARVHREKIAPAVAATARTWAKKLGGVMTCKPSGALSSDGPGLGYAYGSWERRDKAGGAVVEKGFYTRVWRWDGGWKIAADVANLVE